MLQVHNDAFCILYQGTVVVYAGKYSACMYLKSLLELGETGTHLDIHFDRKYMPSTEDEAVRSIVHVGDGVYEVVGEDYRDTDIGCLEWVTKGHSPYLVQNMGYGVFCVTDTRVWKSVRLHNGLCGLYVSRSGDYDDVAFPNLRVDKVPDMHAWCWDLSGKPYTLEAAAEYDTSILNATASPTGVSGMSELYVQRRLEDPDYRINMKADWADVYEKYIADEILRREGRKK